MKTTLKQELEMIFRKVYPQISLHAVDDFRTQLQPLDAAGLITKKVQLDMILVLCQQIVQMQEDIKQLQLAGSSSQENAKPITTAKRNA